MDHGAGGAGQDLQVYREPHKIGAGPGGRIISGRQGRGGRASVEELRCLTVYTAFTTVT